MTTCLMELCLLEILQATLDRKGYADSFYAKEVAFVNYMSNWGYYYIVPQTPEKHLKLPIRTKSRGSLS